MKVATREEIQKLDSLAVSLGIPSEILMENAADAVFSFLKMRFGLDKKFLIFAGVGNNGGDALALARKLSSHFAKVSVFIVGEKSKFKGEALKNLNLLSNYPVEVIEFEGINRILLFEIQKSDVIVDGIFGTGLNREIKGNIKELIVEINNSNKPVVAVDIPSGVDANTGKILGEAVKANYTITFGLPKRGFFAYPGSKYAGKVIVSHISYPPELTNYKEINVEIPYIEPIPERKKDAHKGSLGKALFIAGSNRYFGAPYFNAMSFLKSGGGLSFLATTNKVILSVSSLAKEIVFIPLEESDSGTISKKNIATLINIASSVDIVAIGSGLSVDEDTEYIVREILLNVKKPIIVDGDGLTILSKNLDILEKREGDTILTPHEGEFSRLTNLTIEEIKNDRFSALFKFMEKVKAITVLKGPNTLIGSNGKIYINTTGNPVLATPGSGDVLVGTITSQIVRKGNVLEGTILGVYLHGLSGDLLAKDYKEGITALDILENLKNAIRYYEDNFEFIKGEFYEGK